jgi:Fe-S cluster biogenesis protein NfuA
MTAAPPDARAAADRVDRLLTQLRSGPDPHAAAVAEELVRCLVHLYGAGLERIVRIVGSPGTHDLCTDPLVESLMLVHDLHPLDPDTRIRRALDRLTPYTGELEFRGIDESGVAHVGLTGSGRGCRSSVRNAVEAATQDAAPEVSGVVVEVAAAPTLLQITRRPELGAAR